MIDWREFFARYVEHVVECEGVDFLSYPANRAPGIPFTDDELAAIDSLLIEKGIRK